MHSRRAGGPALHVLSDRAAFQPRPSGLPRMRSGWDALDRDASAVALSACPVLRRALPLLRLQHQDRAPARAGRGLCGPVGAGDRSPRHANGGAHGARHPLGRRHALDARAGPAHRTGRPARRDVQLRRAHRARHRARSAPDRRRRSCSALAADRRDAREPRRAGIRPACAAGNRPRPAVRRRSRRRSRCCARPGIARSQFRPDVRPAAPDRRRSAIDSICARRHARAEPHRAVRLCACAVVQDASAADRRRGAAGRVRTARTGGGRARRP